MEKEKAAVHTEKEVVKSDVALREEEILAFWDANDIFNKSVEKDAPHGDFVFYDGPPFATGTPHYGHILAGTIKDAIPRFWTMQGYRVIRKWGWDCHGLPLENIIEKRLGLATKRDIEAMGVKQFNQAAKDAVLEYADDWKEIVPRMGRFVDMEDDYRTMDATYTESVWWVFGELNRKGLVYEGFKSMHLCPRCGTTLSNFEVNQGYKDIKDIAVTVKLPLLDDSGAVTDTSLLVWTTTPWTLPGNMAAAVHNTIEYVKVSYEVDGVQELVILAKERLAQLGTEHYEVREVMKGSDLVGRRYVPPFPQVYGAQSFPNKENAWQIYHADYVELGEEGTGAVHLAPAYGEEDMELAKQMHIPIMHHVGEDGRFKDFVTPFVGQLVKPKDDEKAEVSHLDADIEVVKYLKESGVLLKKENITHSYPHCWRCDTPLLNYATTSWFVRVTDIKDALVRENNTVGWVPQHVGTNRFGKWLEGARDWAISRQRYWGAPLPIWRREDTKAYTVIGSLKEMQQYVHHSKNEYFLMRHGESVYNTKGVLNGVMDGANMLTELGKAQTQHAYEPLRGEGIEYIYYSPLARTHETAMIIGEALGIPEERRIVDDRLREMEFGEFEGRQVDAYHAFFGDGVSRLMKHPEGGESWTDVKRRVGEFLYEIDLRHTSTKILIVSHNGTMQMLQAVAHGDEKEALGKIIDADAYDLKNAEVRRLAFLPMPHNDEYELDFHRPFIDEIQLHDTDGTPLVRVPDVFDCWFESGAMPYAQQHYPFEHCTTFNPDASVGFPANFISESVDQTRGWFYSLIVLGTALFGKTPFEHVITNGLVLAEDGKKMSKSLKNYPDPMELAGRVGVDAMRLYLLSSPLIKGEDLNFSEKEVLELQRKNIGRLHNVLAMYEMYQDSKVAASDSSPHVLDRWILARLNETTAAMTLGYKNYELDRATRPIETLIDDVSVWYLRRSRERLKGTDMTDMHHALGTLRHVLKTTALLIAPVMPFYAEYLFLRVREEGDAESVHLMMWPKGGEVHTQLILDMAEARRVTSLALEARAKASIKVRQPLGRLTIKTPASDIGYLYEIISDEVNVKEISADPALNEEVLLDLTISPALKAEGEVRELMRAIQDARKEVGLLPQDRVVLMLDKHTEALILPFTEMLMHTVGAREIQVHDAAPYTVVAGDATYRFGIEKI